MRTFCSVLSLICFCLALYRLHCRNNLNPNLKRYSHVVALFSVLMAYSGALSFLFAAGVWCASYAFVAVVGIVQIFNILRISI